MNDEEYKTLDALGIAQLVSTRQASATEVLDCAIRVAGAIEPRVHSLALQFPEMARSVASAFDYFDAPFAGVPTVLKDIMGECQGVPTRFGSAFVPPIPSTFDSITVQRMKLAGFIPFAKSVVPEFGLLPFSTSRLHGAVRNPWDVRRNAGGSSSGAAAAVAAGIVPVAHASDGGGSIRIPAACCGIVGLKPSRGRTSFGPRASDPSNGLISELVVTRTVRDTAASLDAIAGNAPGDPFWAPRAKQSFLQMAERPGQRLFIGYSTAKPGGGTIDPEVAAATEKIAHLCETLGHTVFTADFSIEDERLHDAYIEVYAVSLAATIDGISAVTGLAPAEGDFEPFTWQLYCVGRDTSASRYILALERLRQVGRCFGEFFERMDVWLTPTLGMLPVLFGADMAGDRVTTLADARILDFVHYCPLYNFSGQPAISLPLQVSKAGLPIGLQFGAPFGEEGRLLSLAGELEVAIPWHARRTRLHAW